MKISCKEKFDCFQFKGDIQALRDFVKEQNAKLLEVNYDSIEDLYEAYFVEPYGEPVVVSFKEGWYIFIDSFYQINAISQEEAKRNYEISYV